MKFYMIHINLYKNKNIGWILDKIFNKIFIFWLFNLSQLNQMSQLFRPKANTLKKINNLPVYQHPADLYNMPIRSISQQKQ